MNKYTPLALLALAVVPANAFFLMPCWPVSSQRIDPIVDPGVVSSHVHQIAGGNGFAPVMDYSTTQAADCTTCFVKGDKSNYWIPAMYVKLTDGTFERVPQVGSASMYYFNEPTRLGPGEKMEPFPKGLRLFAGDPEKRSAGTDLASQALNYKCLDYNGTPTDSKTFPTKNCPDGVRAEVTYPSCWDGENLDSSDHKSHVSYPTTNFESGACPSTHPHHLVTLKVEFIFDTNSFKDQWSGGQQPFLWANGDPTGYSLHGDYLMGWDYDLLSSAVAQCFDEYGVLANCAPFADQIQSAYVNPGTCKVESFVDEDIDGKESALPGCNTVQSGPAAAVKAACNNGVKLLGTWANTNTNGLLGSTDSNSSTTASVSASVSASVLESASASTSMSVELSTSYPASSYSNSWAAVALPSSTTLSVLPQGFYGKDSAPAASSSSSSNSAPAAASPSPAPSPAPSQDQQKGTHKIITVTDIITETTYITEHKPSPITQAAAVVSSQGWGKWRREIGDDVHKHHLRHFRNRRRDQQS